MRRYGSICLLLPLALTGCSRPPSAPPPNRVPEVLVATALSRSDIVDYETFTGRTEASATALIRPRVTGQVVSAPFKEGDVVKEGAVLYELDKAPFKADEEEALANQALAKARFDRLERDLERARRLLGTSSIGREEFEKIQGDRLEAEAAVGVAAAKLKKARLYLGYTTVVAPFTGRVGRRMVDPGNSVKADETILTSIGTEGKVYAYFDIDERTILRQLLRKGAVEAARAGKLKVELSLADETDFHHHGVINFVDNHIDTGTGTLWLRALITEARRVIAPGMFIRVRVPVSDPYSAVVVAEQAIGTDQGQKFVYVVDDKNQVRYSEVKIGRLQDGLRVIKEGLKPGERIVVNGLQRVRAKAEVVPKMVDMPVRTAAPTKKTVVKEE